MKVYYAVIPCLFILAGCIHNYSPAEYLSDLQKNTEIIRQYSDDSHTIKCSYLPTTFLAIKDAQKVTGHEQMKAEFKEAFKKYNNSAYFTLTLSSNTGENILMENVRSKEEYFSRMNFLTSGMTDSFFIIQEDGDTVKSSLYDYQRSYGNSPDATLLMVFPKSETVNNKEESLKFYYKDKLLGLNQVARLVFDNKALKEDNINITF